ncbi:DUF4226 domain-containing protein, partial [Nocardia neocaledoniensis]|uniref:DUF4226 domain-containing protein n=1 Tax=Nocardia neocaledoniensis TaxID=236511 RepID=UPI001649E04C
MTAIPSLISALTGGGGGGGGQAAPVANGTSVGSGAAMTPEARRALQILEALAAAYGDGDTSDPQVAALRKELGIEPGKGKTANAVKARELFQRNAAGAFNSLDNQLATYITELAGSNKVDRAAITGLLREVNQQLAELGPLAYTKQGQQKVHQILAAALDKAHTITSTTQRNNSETAATIHKLTNQYLNDI